MMITTKNSLQLALAAFFLATAVGLHGQDNGDRDNRESEPAAEETAPGEEQAEQPPPRVPVVVDEDFTPTERISEDLSVPFPVDI